MALNPAFTSQTSRKLPLAFGYVLAQGDQVLQSVTLDGSQYALSILGEGEWDGYESTNTFAFAASGSSPAVPPHMVRPPVLSDASPAVFASALAGALHFHAGAYTPIGAVVPTVDPTTGLIPVNASQDNGPTQGYDPWFTAFPTVAPPQSFSGIAYAIWRWGATGTFRFGSYIPGTIATMALWRALRCRIFDAYGNVVSYGFTLNPAWHKVEAILRRKIRPEQPPLSALTAAEKACFNWESITELAARNDYILPNGNPRFVGSYAFAADSTLAQMMETMCRVDRSFQRIDNGQIVLQGDDARASVFIASAKHLVPGTMKLDKKDVSKAPNVFVPSYRDLEIPAVGAVTSAVITSINRLSIAYAVLAITATTASPFTDESFVTYGGCSDPTRDGVYRALVPDGDELGGTVYPNNTYAWVPTGSAIEVVSGGYIGSEDARFKPRSPDGVNHRSAQRIKAPQAPGLATQPTKIRVMYDCGNSTFDQTNRLMKFERDRSLGTDTGAGWKAPISGTLSLFFESVDVNGAQLPLQARAHNVITLDSWLYPEAPGDYEIMSIKIVPPSEGSPGQIDLTLHAYNRDAYTDVSDDPGNYYMSVPNSNLQLSGFTPLINPAWVLNATLAITADVSGDGNLTIAIPDLLMQRVGFLGPTAFPGFTVSGVPVGTPVALWVEPSEVVGVAPTYGWSAMPFVPSSPPVKLLVATGSFVL